MKHPGDSEMLVMVEDAAALTICVLRESDQPPYPPILASFVGHSHEDGPLARTGLE